MCALRSIVSLRPVITKIRQPNNRTCSLELSEMKNQGKKKKQQQLSRSELFEPSTVNSVYSPEDEAKRKFNAALCTGDNRHTTSTRQTDPTVRYGTTSTGSVLTLTASPRGQRRRRGSEIGAAAGALPVAVPRGLGPPRAADLAGGLVHVRTAVGLMLLLLPRFGVGFGGPSFHRFLSLPLPYGIRRRRRRARGGAGAGEREAGEEEG